ncbi:hypothetical protein [Haloechinothrix salitolerans]|uniref:TrbL/VirB6 plasmid conjugal transfer protein n=1 Tax=Haloechinothrix salitolerans TaxID=926830 RepID=A0ABW2C6L8_9PSEU
MTIVPEPPPPEPCADEDCIPDPTPPPDGEFVDPGSDGGGPADMGEADCGLFDLGCHLEALFRGIVESALNPLLRLMSDTLLMTPTLQDLPQVGPLWRNSWELGLAVYSTLILLAGILVMSYESVQTRYTIKELLPRLVVGFLAAFVSLFVAEKAIRVANALSSALLADGLDTDSAGDALGDMVSGALSGGGLFLLLLGLALAVLLVALLITYILRVAITVILVIGAPLALVCHALPQTEGVARWWWRAFAAVLAIQIVQSLTLLVALRVFFDPSGWNPWGPTPSGLINLLVAITLVYILLKIPFWILSATRLSGGRRSLMGSVVRGWIAYKTFGVLTGRAANSGDLGHTARVAQVHRPGAPATSAPGVRPGAAPASPARSTTPTPVRPTGPYTAVPTQPAPPIEATPQGQGRPVEHTSERESRRSGQDRRRTGLHNNSTVGVAGSRQPRLPDRAERARAAGRQAWRPLANSASATPQRNQQQPDLPSHSVPAVGRAADRLAQRAPQPPLFRAVPPAPRDSRRNHPRRGGRTS